ncbi:MAG: rRNA adenine N-6-methyltransferase family protein, partial [Buchnera aphidicola]|nr:16S rRNA (adenine(1518)-N(6)/adenine(1519)-N(6))-dimethyltransferase [Buchnera aphidicola]MDE5286024.1 rRNA adenine N-6-methyltransferase family protein [Buchnera aphidicola]
VFGNLPYNISISILLNLFKQVRVIKDMNFMLQKEVAHRLVAEPGNKNYGRLSILSQYYFNIKILLKVNSQSFFPVPRVDSMFVNFIPR